MMRNKTGGLGKGEKNNFPGRRLSIEESRSRLRDLVEQEDSEQGQKVESQESLEQVQKYEADSNKKELVSEAADVDLAGKPTSDYPVSDDDSDSLLTDEEEQEAVKASVKEAIRWLLAWWQRQKEKMSF